MYTYFIYPNATAARNTHDRYIGKDDGKMKISINVEDYGLERKELAAAGAIKHGLDKIGTEEALARLDDPAELLREVIKTVNVNELDTGNVETRQIIVDYVKSMNITEVLDNPSEGFQQFLADCRDVIEKR